MAGDRSAIRRFLDGGPFAVAGASRSRTKYGNKVLRAYLQTGRRVYPVNPNADDVEGLRAWPDLASLPERPHALSIVTPPDTTQAIVRDAIELGIEHLWLQPGAEQDSAIGLAERAGCNIIHSGPCILVALSFREA
ncbi:MAG TPA: CoA-binding protein [Candidatus Polarisedimenticolaceae bacterium]|nr:CoA-binding protein [Candidatus Polarisedimenticolaceae bacterium]